MATPASRRLWRLSLQLHGALGHEGRSSLASLSSSFTSSASLSPASPHPAAVQAPAPSFASVAWPSPSALRQEGAAPTRRELEKGRAADDVAPPSPPSSAAQQRRAMSSSAGPLAGPEALYGEQLLLEFSGDAEAASGCLSVALNRPKQLNALSESMVLAFRSLLFRAEEDPRVSLLLLAGEGGRAFCAGGDVRRMREAPKADVVRFFGQEYALIYHMSRIKKPVVALWDGIVMGGGVGISIFASHRICTETTVWAMPEAAIGLFPDVAAAFFLPRLKSSPAVGFYAGLVGARFQAEDLVKTGLATHFVPRARLEALSSELKKVSGFLAPEDARAEVDRILAAFAEPIPGSSSASASSSGSLSHLSPAVMEGIEKYFSALPPTYKDLVSTLEQGEASGCAFAAEVMKSLHERCPLSCAVWFSLFTRALRQKAPGAASGTPFFSRRREEGETLLEVLRQDFTLAQALICAFPDNFREGVRAVLVDKDNRPRWTPPTADGLTEEDVARVLNYEEAEGLDRFLHG
ncbi:enoyl-CoA hydratase/isomerase family protein [Besnoitia besnoiti]|uniref:3-hydroxyisobutyryl-CoA hydrolase n=1 Tax=Besnoitia besnoiti TaxID=94643 RepID=A0A2A9MDI0_BESBE|nr:enoyl-CoA hydratase/isomerase family protein [Besnoitia besnoiti]PFH33743.1 enoyl-CoA hydratase/isomerase family protein [Besnoitia besnoiti]